MGKAGRGVVAMVGQRLAGGGLHTVQPFQQQLRAFLGGQRAAVQPHGFTVVVQAVLHKAHQAGQVHLTAFLLQEVLQIVVA